ncbi:probable multidrug resistance-associated protein lethal(2)03659 [Halyomorpha halys]|uniref:probable multidrug resistance-associated protein lethal(2)03659 n=1 Tax=Halyomorpha halys TaxID=286706 RepID=UPI0006D52673|nr:probable multidrug resistance-associated protein lethal(2)03659 [Halyomorpha halys]XP_014275650.1 probable multidrug resistance-associated protein lethal(2)03659 [Halyomorpha halys]
MESDKDKTGKKGNPRAAASIISALTFSWTLPLFWEGHSRDLTVEDLPEPLKEHSSGYLGDQIEKLWDEEVAKAQLKKKEPSLLRVVVKMFGLRLMLYGTVIFFSEIVLRVGQPLLLGGLIRYFSSTTMSKEEAYMYAAGVIACSGLTVIMMHPYMMAIMHTGMKVRVAACSLIYRKSLKLSKTALGQTTAGQVVNLLSNDVNRFDIAFIFLHILWIGPLQTCIVTYLMWTKMELAALLGLISLLLFIPFQGWLGKRASSLRLKTAARTDERVRLMNEIISGIQVIKMYTWEKPFAHLVEIARRKEIKEITKSSYIKGIMLSFIIFHARTAIFFTILSYVLLGNRIDAEKVFVLTSFYSTLRQTMTVFFPQGITQVAEGLISIKRIKAFLMINDPHLKKPKHLFKVNGKVDLENNGIQLINDEKKDPITAVHYTGKTDKPGIFIKNATAKWVESSHENTLTNITFDVVPGVLTAIIGPVGSGKTSLFHAILRELNLTSGSIQVNGQLSYASQEPWLFHGSVRQNILFGLEYNRDRYRQVVKVCSLRTDFELLPYGDKTIVGERGVSLSGGQRARINLARAVYKEADVYLLDDPLSAVDTHVGKHLFEDCIQGYLKKKTVILITHQLQYLDSVDQIVLLENGTVSAIGSNETLQKSGLDFTKLMSEKEHKEVVEETPIIRTLGSRQSSIQSMTSSCFDEINTDFPVEVAETQTKGSVSGRVYRAYISAGGGCCQGLFLLFMCIFSQALASGGDYWITYWVNLEEHFYGPEIGDSNFMNATSALRANITNNITNVLNDTVTYMNEIPYVFVVSRETCIHVFTGITVATIIVTIFRSFYFFYSCMQASINLHNRMFESITRATMWFFNNNTSGRILNRFSKDMGAIDELLPSCMMDVMQIGITLMGIIIVVASVNPYLLVPTFGAGLIFYFLRNFYLSTSRSVKRLEGVSRSPVFSHLNASIQGLTTIRAFKAERVLREEFDNHQDLHSSAWYLFIASSRAFGFWLDMVCLVYIGMVTLSFLVLGGENFGGNVGLAISQAIGLTGMFQWGMRQSAELENQMTSVERVLEYSDIEMEPPLESPPDKKPRATWPEKGRIEFSDVHLRYSAAEPWVLKNLNFVILPQQKVGIVGRTGAGKSSLISALFRLAEVDGEITVDDIETSTLGLHELRSKISIIPQEPVLFSGRLRKNLDPFDEYSDDVLWNALDEVELREVVKELPGGLHTQISEGGSNMSVGQRQLICLARAIIRNNRILVLDEATANVDPQTDSLIQQTIRSKFANCTVLTIAHRLNTVMDSDKILVMDAGTMVEFGHPHILLENKYGFLHKMVQQTGKATEETLTKIASENYQSRKPEESEESSVI